jgi:peptidoglycan/LPS O-acetylase OafA/YrhL
LNTSDVPAVLDLPVQTSGTYPTAVPRKYVASLDGLRSIAILAVMGFHAGVPGASLGWLGVDLFFVLSGFLITTLLADEYARENRVSLRKFWGRRFLRLMPVYWLYVGALTLAMLVFHWGWLHNVGKWSVDGYIASLWLYYANISPLSGIWEHQSLAGHLWSLAVEEQFYLVWPPLFLIALRLRCVTWLAWSLVIAVLVRRVIAMDHFRLDTRGLGLVLGCAVALSLRSERLSFVRRFLCFGPFRLFIPIVILLIVGVADLFKGRGISDEAIYTWVTPVCVALFSVLTAMLWYGSNDLIARSLAWRPMVYIGRISYGMYIYHMLAHYIAWDILASSLVGVPSWLKYGLRLLVFYAATIGLATLSYQFIEKPFLRLKALLR